MLPKIRAALIVTILWVLCWVPVGVGLDHVLADILFPEPRIDSPYTPVGIWLMWGALSGLSFAIVLGLGERGRAVGSLSILRVVSWGAVGSALVPAFFYVYHALMSPAPDSNLASVYWRIALLTVGLSALLGMICALGILALMRAGRSR